MTTSKLLTTAVAVSLFVVSAVCGENVRFESVATLCMDANAAVGLAECPAHGWHSVEPASPQVLKTLVFAVKHRDTDALDEALKRVSEPDSPEYGQYLSLHQLGELTRNDVALDAVKGFLRSFGVSDRQIEETANGEFLVVRVPVAIAEPMLEAEFFVFENSQAPGIQVMRTASYSVPEELAQHLDFVGETIQFPALRGARSHRRGPIVNKYVTPELINSVYNIPSNLVKSQKSTQSLFESLGQNYSPADLQMFQRRMDLNESVVAKVIGPNYDDACERDPSSCGEANLDVQYIMAMATNAPTTFWSVEGNVEPFLQWIVAVADDPDPPLVHSVSYGSVENDPSTFKRFNEEVQKLGLRGVTVVVSSGDDGVGNFPIRSDPSACGFNPSFPASCPFVVAVGATQGPESGSEEIACSSDTDGIVTSGGGFSTVFDQPSYQKDAVQQFFKNSRKEDLPPPDHYHTGGRAYPDIALLGYNYIIVDDEQLEAESGTSASAPVFAGMLALINGELLANGKPPVGFFNPLLYNLAKTTPDAFNDVTKGHNHCGAGRPPQIVCCRYGFTATEGYDPVTGLGSVHFTKLRDAILSHHGVEEERGHHEHSSIRFGIRSEYDTTENVLVR